MTAAAQNERGRRVAILTPTGKDAALTASTFREAGIQSLVCPDITSVEQAINEYGPGQQEIAIRYDTALRAADNQVKFRDAVRGVVEIEHDLICSFAAKPFADGVGSGAHIHFRRTRKYPGRCTAI